MKSIPFLTLLFLNLIPAILLSQHLTLKPQFKLKDSITYIVTEKQKSSDLFILSSGSHRFLTTFKIVDTTRGFTILFTSKLLEPIKEKLVAESMLDKLRDGISLTYKMNDSGWLVGIPDYTCCQKRILDMFDSIYFVSDFAKTDHILLQALRGKLSSPDGLQLLLEPLMAFNEAYLLPVLRTQSDYHAAASVNIFYQRYITGTLITKLKTLDQQNKSAIVSLDFIANADSAAQKIIPAFKELIYKVRGKIPKGLPEEAKFERHAQLNILLDKMYPSRIYRKTVITYITKNTSEITMELASE